MNEISRTSKIVLSGPGYKTGRRLASTITVVGWIVGILGGLILLFGFGALSSHDPFAKMMGFWLLSSGLGAIGSGIALLAVSELLVATFDTADNTRHMLEIMKN